MLSLNHLQVSAAPPRRPVKTKRIGDAGAAPAAHVTRKAIAAAAADGRFMLV
jgi:hypothetical protein